MKEDFSWQRYSHSPLQPLLSGTPPLGSAASGSHGPCLHSGFRAVPQTRANCTDSSIQGSLGTGISQPPILATFHSDLGYRCYRLMVRVGGGGTSQHTCIPFSSPLQKHVLPKVKPLPWHSGMPMILTESCQILFLTICGQDLLPALL